MNLDYYIDWISKFESFGHLNFTYYCNLQNHSPATFE